jgi:hypothetical protein
MAADHAGDSIRRNKLAAPQLQLSRVGGIFETKRPQAMLAVVDAMPIKVNHVVRIRLRPLQFGFERRKSRRIENLELRQLTQLRERFHHRPGTHPMVDVAGEFVLGARADQQHPDRRFGRHRPLRISVG